MLCDDLEGQDGWGSQAEPKREEIYIVMTDLLCCMAETNTIL